MPSKGITLADVFEDDDIDVESVIQQMKETAKQSGVPMGSPRKIFNTRLAQELGVLADLRGKGDTYHLAAFKAYFVDNANLFDRNVLMNLAKSVCLGEKDVEEAIDGRRYKSEIDNDWQRGRELGVRVIPTFYVGGERVVGGNSYLRLSQLMEKAKVSRRMN